MKLLVAVDLSEATQIIVKKAEELAMALRGFNFEVQQLTKS